MDRLSAVYQWQHELKQHLPELSAPQAKELALWSMAVLQTNRASLSDVMVEISTWLGISPNTAKKRLKDLYLPQDKKSGKKRRTLEPAESFADLLRWVLELLPAKHLVLALDASNKSNKLIVLCVSVVLGGCAIPVAWHLVPSDQKGAWREHWMALLERLRPAIPESRDVLVLADRGLWGPWLFEKIRTCGWHALLRVNDKANPRFRTASDACWRTLSHLSVFSGQQICQRVHLFKGRPMACFLICFFGETAKEPWYLVTDSADIHAAAYAQRFWIECSFKCIKSRGFDWESTRIQDPARMARVWLVYAVSLLLSLSRGSQEEARHLGREPGLFRLSGCLVRAVSLFSWGRAAVRSLIASGSRLFCPIFARHIWGYLPLTSNTS